MRQIVICEDVFEHAEYLKNAVEGFYFGRDHAASLCHDPAELSGWMEENGEPDILFMDICFERDDGVSTVASLLPPNARTQLIFVTGYIENCVRVYDVPHVYFLTKPIDKESLRKALTAAEKKLEELDAASIVVKSGNSIHVLRSCDILYMESDHRIVRIHSRNGVISVYAQLSRLASQAGEDFVHCHQSFCINRNFVQKMTPDHFLLYGGQKIPISQRRYAEAKKAFLGHLAHQTKYKGAK